MTRPSIEARRSGSRRKLLQLCLVSALASLQVEATDPDKSRQLSTGATTDDSPEATTNEEDTATTEAPTERERDWKDHMLDCFHDMKHADQNADKTLSLTEYEDFCNRYGNRIFVTKNIIAQQHYWQLEELYEELVLENPFGNSDGHIGIYGARIVTRDAMDEKETRFLQKICNQSEKVIRLLGPTQAKADRAGEKCDLHENKIKYYGGTPQQQNGDTDSVVEGTLEGNATVIIETFHNHHHSNDTWVEEVFDNGTKIELWNDRVVNDTLTADLPQHNNDDDDDSVWIYENPVVDNIVDAISGLFGFNGEDEEAVLELEDEAYQARNGGEEGDERKRHLRYVTRHKPLLEEAAARQEEKGDEGLIESDFAMEDKEGVF